MGVTGAVGGLAAKKLKMRNRLFVPLVLLGGNSASPFFPIRIETQRRAGCREGTANETVWDRGIMGTEGPIRRRALACRIGLCGLCGSNEWGESRGVSYSIVPFLELLYPFGNPHPPSQ